MFKKLQFARDLEGITSTNIDEIYARAESLAVREEELFEIKLNKESIYEPDLPEGAAQSDTPTQVHSVTIDGSAEVTLKGLSDVCKLMKIPHNFALAIPIDLLYHNINKLSSDGTAFPKCMIIRRDATGETTAVSSVTTVEVTYSEFLDAFAHADNIEVSMDEDTLALYYDVAELEPFDENLKAATVAVMSQTKRLRAYAATCLKHSHGYILMPFLGKTKMSYNVTDTAERVMRFQDKISGSLNTDAYYNLQENMDIVKKVNLSKIEILNLVKTLAQVIGSADAMVIMNLTVEELDLYKVEVKVYKDGLKKSKLLSLNFDGDISSTLNVYETAIAISAYAHTNASDSKRLYLEALAGKLLFNALTK